MNTKKQTSFVEQHLLASDRGDIRQLCRMSDSELMAFIDDYMETADEEFDRELFDAAQSLLDERVPVEVSIDVEGSFEKFKRDHSEIFPVEQGRATAVGEKSPRHSIGKWGSYGRVALVALGALVAIVMAAYAANPTFFQPVTDLGDRVVRLISWGPSGDLELPDNVNSYGSLREALDKTGATDALAATWVPQDLKLTDIRAADVSGSDTEKSYWAAYEGEGKTILFHIESKAPNIEGYFDEKDASGETTFTRNGITYHKVTNMGTVQINWDSGNYTYSMSGSLNEEDYFHIIDSLR